MKYNPADEPVRFYGSKDWDKVSAMVRKADHYQCVLCGSARRPLIVHHVKHLKDRPDLALSLRDPDTGERQLITVCKRCHEKLHPEALQEKRSGKKVDEISAERWD